MSNAPFVDQQNYNVAGVSNSPFTDQRAVTAASGSTSGLSVDFDKDNSTLKLEDTVDGTTTTLSTTAVVPGRTVKISRHTLNTYLTPTSIFDLQAGSGDSGPPPSARCVGNNPPSVPLDAEGNSLWSVGNSFRVTASGRLIQFVNGDRVNVKLWSNRGQNTELEIASFNVPTTGSNAAQIGWRFIFDFTCRETGTNGTFSGNCQFLYSDDTTPREVEGAIWVSNANSTFNTDIPQFLDVTFELQGQIGGASMALDMAIIERLY